MLKFILIITLLTSIVVATTLAYMCFMAAERNGWQTLAERFRLSERFRGQRLHARSAILNGHAFHLTLVIGASAEGLFLRPSLAVRLFHAPLLIPWSAFDAIDFVATHSRGRRLSLTGLVAPDGSPMALDLSEALCQELLASLNPDSGEEGLVEARRVLAAEVEA